MVPVKILGETLTAFRLGHLLTLENLASPFVQVGGDSPQLGDLILATEIIRQKPSREKLTSRRLSFKNWKWRIAFGWIEINDPYVMQRQIRELTAWLQRHCRMPESIRIAREAGSLTQARWAWALKAHLQAELGYSPNSAVDLPLQQVFLEISARDEWNQIRRQLALARPVENN